MCHRAPSNDANPRNESDGDREVRVAIELTAANGLRLWVEPSGAVHLGWGEPDWLGPGTVTIHQRDRISTSAGETATLLSAGDPTPHSGRDERGSFRGLELGWTGLPFPLRTLVRAYEEIPLVVFRLEAPDGLRDNGSGRFADPLVAWPHFRPSQRAVDGIAAGATSYAHQLAEFALPVFGNADVAGFVYAPHRPPAVQPLLLIAPDRRTLLIGPLDCFHEQVIIPPADDSVGVRCGWHGDLAEAANEFATELAVWAAASPRAALEAWIGDLRRSHATHRPSRYADPGLSRLSYWTDNGAYYYYRTEPEADYATTLVNAIADCEQRGLAIEVVQLDSWFYPHENVRPVSAEGAPIVPPSGLMLWEPRADLFPDGFGGLQTRLGNRPLAFHSRHFSRQSPYFERFAAWEDGDYAHPQDARLFDELLGNAAAWGAVTYEQDWMVESFFGVRGLRAAPGRARRWQEGLDRIAGEHGLTLQWCMATPSDFLQSVSLRHLTSIRTSGDYRYLFDNGLNWVWFFHTNALARALGLNAFKDVFLSDREAEPYAEIEALLAALSAGPVGIGDRIGRSDRDLIMRTCREDGLLVKPDAPVAAIDHCFQAHGYFAQRLLVGETYSRQTAGLWRYIVVLHASRDRNPIRDRIALAELGGPSPSGAVIVYDWRRGTWEQLAADGGWETELAWQDWDYRVLCPLLAGERTIFGDVGKYATVGDRRLAGIEATADEIRFDVLGVPQTTVEIHGYSAQRPTGVETVQSGASTPLSADRGYTWSAADGRWIARIVMDRGHSVHVRMRW